MKSAVLIIILFGIVLGLLNIGPLIDAIRYRHFVETAQQILPDDWAQTIQSQTPAEAVVALNQSLSDPQRVTLEGAHGRFREGRGGVVLALADGFETAELSLLTGCFVHAQRTVNLIVWQYEISTGCL